MSMRFLKTGSFEVVWLVLSLCGKDVGLWAPQRANSAGSDSAILLLHARESGAPDLLLPLLVFLVRHDATEHRGYGEVGDGGFHKGGFRGPEVQG